jgi:hypothetical protein
VYLRAIDLTKIRRIYINRINIQTEDLEHAQSSNIKWFCCENKQSLRMSSLLISTGLRPWPNQQSAINYLQR